MAEPIDERIERLTERNKALTGSLELLNAAREKDTARDKDAEKIRALLQTAEIQERRMRNKR